MKITHNLIFDDEQAAIAFMEKAAIYKFRFGARINFQWYGRTLLVNDKDYTILVASNFMNEESK